MSSVSSLATNRLLWLACLAAVIGLMAYAIYAERVLYLDPCPLCITQRAFYIGIGVMALVGALSVSRRGLQIGLGVLASLCAVGGIVTAGRQVWLQHLPPDQVPECGPGLQYWLDNMPWMETLSLLFRGDGNCAEVHWRFLGLSMGEWSLIWFVILLLVLLSIVARQWRGGRAALATSAV